MRHKSVQMLALASVASALLLTGCEREEVTVYTVPKEQSAPTVAARQSDSSNVPVNAAPISWKLPAGWKERPSDGIRIGSFQVPGKEGKQAEVAITSFPGTTGTELENWNRWRREVGLAETSAQEMKSDKITIGSEEGKFYQFEGEKVRSVVGVLSRDGSSWFFKMRGDKSAVVEAEPTFVEFLKSIEFQSGATAQPKGVASAAADPHANVPGFRAAAEKPEPKPESEASEEDGESPKWEVPANWTEKPPGMMVLKSFVVGDDKGSATIAISQFPGDVGGTFANVNRWRGQLGLPPIKQSELGDATTTVDTAEGKATFVDIKGTDSKTGKPARMVAAMLPHAGNTWFYKMTGDESVVGREKESFTKFVQSVRFP